MNIYEYIDKYGDYTFDEKEFNQVDKVIFSFLSYANLEKVFEDDLCLTIAETGKQYLELHPGKDINIIAIKEGNKLLKYLRNKKRYMDCKLYNYEYIGNDEVQFGVVSIEYLPNQVFVSFEGTDSLFSGWREDFILGYQFPTISQKLAIKYLNKHFTFKNKSLIVGGHSKGGNLALVASMYANAMVRSKIVEIINADGPGLLDNEYKSVRYSYIKSKYTHIIPNYSLVGLFLNNSNNYVVSATSKSILAHNIVYWEIDEDKFIKTKLSDFSQELDVSIKKWFSKYNKEDKQNFINNLDYILKEANVTSILDIKTKKKNLFNLIAKSKDMNSHTKKVLTEFIMLIIKCFGNVKKEELKDFLSNMFKITSRTFQDLPFRKQND